jgi:hypothetical protein
MAKITLQGLESTGLPLLDYIATTQGTRPKAEFPMMHTKEVRSLVLNAPIVLWHGTKKEHAASIAEKGLIPSSYDGKLFFGIEEAARIYADGGDIYEVTLPAGTKIFDTGLDLDEIFVTDPVKTFTKIASLHKRLYHGSAAAKFDKFKTERNILPSFNKDDSGRPRMGAYFTESLRGALRFSDPDGFVYAVDLTLNKPLDLRNLKSEDDIENLLPGLLTPADKLGILQRSEIGSGNGMYLPLEALDESSDFVPKIKKLGYDGIIYPDSHEGDTYVALEPNQIKIVDVLENAKAHELFVKENPEYAKVGASKAAAAPAIAPDPYFPEFVAERNVRTVDGIEWRGAYMGLAWFQDDVTGSMMAIPLEDAQEQSNILNHTRNFREEFKRVKDLNLNKKASGKVAFILKEGRWESRPFFGLPKKATRVDLPGGIVADIIAEPTKFVSIYEWSSGDPGKGNTKKALKYLKETYQASIHVHDIGEPGTPSADYWNKMLQEGFVDKLYQGDKEIKTAARQTWWHGTSTRDAFDKLKPNYLGIIWLAAKHVAKRYSDAHTVNDAYTIPDVQNRMIKVQVKPDAKILDLRDITNPMVQKFRTELLRKSKYYRDGFHLENDKSWAASAKHDMLERAPWAGKWFIAQGYDGVLVNDSVHGIQENNGPLGYQHESLAILNPDAIMYSGQKKSAPKSIWYHGSLSHNLQSIMQNGLLPNSEKNWDNDSGSLGLPSRDSYGGIYFSRNIVTAFGSPRVEKGRGDSVLIVICQLQPNTFYLDEDALTTQIGLPLGYSKSYSTSLLVTNYLIATQPNVSEYARTHNDMDKFKKEYVQECLRNFKSKFKTVGIKFHPDLEERLTNLLPEMWLAALKRLVAHAVTTMSDTTYWMLYNQVIDREQEKIPDKSTLFPSVEEGESEFRKLAEQFTRTLRLLGRYINTFNPTVRVNSPVGFNGANRIIGIIEVQDNRALEAGAPVSVEEGQCPMVIHYGTVPQDFFTQWKERMGSKPVVKAASSEITLYHGTSERSWTEEQDDSVLYLTKNLEDAKSYAYEQAARDEGKGVTPQPVIMSISLSELQRHEQFISMEPDWGAWGVSDKSDATWEETLKQFGSMAISGRLTKFKSRFSKTPLPVHKSAANIYDETPKISSGGFPLKKFKYLYHVGSMDANDKRSGSYEGSGLSVSMHPDEWRGIAQISGHTWQLTKQGNKFLDFHKLSPNNRKQITDWGIKNGYAVRTTVYRSEWYDDELEDTVAMHFVDKLEAEEQGGTVTEIPDGLNGTEKLTKRTNQHMRFEPAMVLDLLATVYAEDELKLDGVWWSDNLSPETYSAPRGVIFPPMVSTWKAEKIQEADEFGRVTARPTDQKVKLITDRYKLTPEQVEQIIACDPTTREYVAWIAKQFHLKQIRLPEDTSKIQQQLEQFTSLKRSPKFKGNKDIQGYTVQNLYKVIEENTEQVSAKEKDRRLLEQGHSGARLILNDGDYKAWVVTDAKSLCTLSSGTNWCTAHEETAKAYLQDSPNYVFYYRNRPYAQFDPESEQFMDKTDDTLVQEFRHNYESIKVVVDPIAIDFLEKLQNFPAIGDFYSKVTASEETIESLYNVVIDSDLPPTETLLGLLSIAAARRFPLSNFDDVQFSPNPAATVPNAEDYILSKVSNRSAGRLMSAFIRYWAAVHPGVRNPKLEHILIPNEVGTIKVGILFYQCVQYASVVIQGRWQRLEEELLKWGLYAPTTADSFLLEYATDVMKARWPEMETLLQEVCEENHGYHPPFPELETYCSRLKGRWPEIEASVIRSSDISINKLIDYAANVIHGRWPELESRMESDGERESTRISYCAKLKFRWPKVENQLIGTVCAGVPSGRGGLFRYMKEVVKGRWPELETVLLNGVRKKVDPVQHATTVVQRNPQTISELTQFFTAKEHEAILMEYLTTLEDLGETWPEGTKLLDEQYLNPNGDISARGMVYLDEGRRFNERPPRR